MWLLSRSKTRFMAAAVALGAALYLGSLMLTPIDEYVVPPPDNAAKLSNDPDRKGRPPGRDRAAALLLSGGGYRAMLFHLGSLWRLNEAGLLPDLSVISSVSGGSIVAATLGLHWNRLQFNTEGVATNFEDEVVSPIRDLANRNVDICAVLGSLIPLRSAPQGLVDAYRRLFGKATLQDLPRYPRIVINATNMQSGIHWRFSRRYMGDEFLVGTVQNPPLELAVAVAASSAFPPFLSPVILRVNESYYDVVDADVIKNRSQEKSAYRTRVVLMDGGVNDNLGILGWPGFSIVLLSDGSLRPTPLELPPRNWVAQMNRAISLIHEQPATLRTKELREQLREKFSALYEWKIGEFDNSGPDYGLPVSWDVVQELAAVPTRLSAMNASLQKQLINWGYAATDIELRSVRTWLTTAEKRPPTLDESAPYREVRAPRRWPYPECQLRYLTCHDDPRAR
jgi:NTE family protein